MTVGGVFRRPAGITETTAANRAWWEAEADAYQAEHGAFLGDARFVWCPEGLDEADARLLGDVAGRRVLEVGCGAAQCARWLAAHGAEVAALDLSRRQLEHGVRLATETGIAVPLVEADAQRLPFAAGSFDVACSAFGALPFVADLSAVFDEVARVLRAGGRWAFSVSHPIRWAFPDDPGQAGLTARDSYFDRTPYVETERDGRTAYAEHHRTVGDWVRALAAAGFMLVDLVEPEWPAGLTEVWGGWSPLRGRLLPGTAVFVADKRSDAGERSATVKPAGPKRGRRAGSGGDQHASSRSAQRSTSGASGVSADSYLG